MPEPGSLTILGGGPAGLGVAFYAERARFPFTLYEKSPHFGGICRTFQQGAHRYDCGAHRFHDRDPDITGDIRELLGDDLRQVVAPNQVWDGGRFLSFPPTPLGLLRSCGLREAGRIGLELARERLRRRPCHSLEDFAVSRFGETLSRRILLNYSEKLWGLKAAELSPDAATRRLKGLSLSSLVAEVMSSTHKTGHLDGSFLYPRQGYGRICEALEQGLPRGALRAQRDVVGLRCSRDRVTRIEFANGDAMAPAGRVLSTLPLTALVSLLGEALPQAAHDSAAALRFRHLRLVFLRLDQPRVSDNASIYVPDLHLCLSRIYEPRNRSTAMAPPGETALVVEVPCFRDDAVGRMGEAAVAERVIDELVQLRLIERRRVIEWKHHFVANAYPVYSRGYADHVSTIRAALEPIGNLDTLGRAGQFVYSHLHDQLRYAKDYVRALTQAGHAPAPIAC